MTEPAKIVRTAAGLRDALFDELDALRGNKSTPQKAQAVSKLAYQIINSVKMEMDAERHTLEMRERAKRSGIEYKRPTLLLGDEDETRT